MGEELEYIRVGNRIPCTYFLTKGIGESDITVHAGSLDDALENAGIENFNILKYTSIMPGIAKRIDRPKKDIFEVDHKGAPKIVHGSVCETIMAEKTNLIGERATAGLIIGWIYDKKTNRRVGGLVAEYSGHEEEPAAAEALKRMMDRMAKQRLKNRPNLEVRDIEIETASIVPKKKYGTAIVVIVFTDYVIPKFKDMTDKDVDALYVYKQPGLR